MFYNFRHLKALQVKVLHQYRNEIKTNANIPKIMKESILKTKKNHLGKIALHIDQFLHSKIRGDTLLLTSV